jgi:hypothetical protein
LQIRAMLSREEKARQSEPFQQTRTVLRLCESSVRVSALADTSGLPTYITSN